VEPQPEWWDAFRVMWHKLLDDVVACGAYTSGEADALCDLLDQQAMRASTILEICEEGQRVKAAGHDGASSIVWFFRSCRKQP
jgi:hypothetical protein